MDINLVIIIMAIFLSGCFSGVEIALTSLGEAKVRSMKDDNRFGSTAILKLQEYPQKVLISILIGNQVANIIATVTATVWVIKIFSEARISMATAIFSVIMIIFTSIGPKTIALRFPETVARAISYPLLWFVYIARPITWIFELIVKGFLKLLKADKKALTSISQEEIEAMLDISAEKGVIGEDEDVFMKQILKFNQTKVEDIMTLLKDIDAIEINTEKEDLIKFFKEHDHTHFPVYEESLNNIKGIVSVHDLVKTLYYSTTKKPLHNFKFQRAAVVPKTASLTELFKVLKEKHRRMVVVIDEHGQTIGLVTLNDILEEIAGVKIETPQKIFEPKIEKCGKNCWEADGEVAVAKINELMDIKLDYPEHEVISLVVLEKLKRFPETNEKIQLDGVEIEIKRVEKNVIKKVAIRKKKTAEKKKLALL